MSRTNSPRKGSPPKHKGMMTSLYNQTEQIQASRMENNLYTVNPSRIYVQTITEQPNVLPYINSGYSSHPQVIGQFLSQSSQAQSEYVIVNQRQNNLMSTTTRPQIITNARVSPVIGQNLNRAKVESSAHYHSRQPINPSTYVPPPPESFLIPNSATKVVQDRSLGKTAIHSVPVPPMIPSQNVKKTFIPHHIINEIPVYTGTVYTESGYRSSSQERQSQQQASGINDESQEVLMGYYEKLYSKYEQEKQRSSAINHQLSQAVSQINFLKSQLQNQSTIQTNIIPPPQRKKVIDRRRLHDLMMSKWSPIVDQIVEKRKQNCLRQISNVVESRRVTIKIPGGQLQQQESEFVYYPR